MAEFGPNVTQAPELGTAATAKAGVVPPTGLEGVDDLFSAAESAIKGIFKNRDDEFLSEFSRAQLMVADSLSENSNMSAAQAKTLLRRNLKEALAAAPHLRDKLYGEMATLQGLDGGTKVISEGTLQEQRTNAMHELAIKEGFVSPDATKQQLDEAVKTMNAYEAAGRRYKTQIETLTLEAAVTDAEQAKRESQIAGFQNELINATWNVEFPRVRRQMEEVASDTTLSPSERSDAIDQIFLDWKQGANEAFGNTGVKSDLRNHVFKQFEEMTELHKGLATDASRRDEVEKQLKYLNTTTQLELVRGSDKIRRSMAVRGVLGEEALNEMGLYGYGYDEVMSFIDGGVEGSGVETTVLTKDPEATKALPDTLNALSKTIMTGTEEQKANANTVLSNLLSTAENPSGIKRDPMKAEAIVKWMASDAFLEVRDSLDIDLDAISQNLTIHYKDEFAGMLEKEFTNNKVVIGTRDETGNMVYTNEPVGSMVRVVEKGNGVVFEPISKGGLQAERAASRLNKKLAPHLNNMLKASAHMNGDKDYLGQWENMQQEYFNAGGGDSDLAGGDAGDDLTLMDLQPEEPSGSAADPVGDVVEAGKGYTVVRTQDGVVERRTGSRNWRNNNPGNIEYGKFAKSKGAIGSDGRFAVFPSYEMGRAAKADLLFESPSYKNKTIMAAINRYAPPSENNSRAYANAVATAVGVDLNTPISSLNSQQREAMLDAMERVEGFREGEVEVVG